MPLDTLFIVANVVALVGWIALAIAPWRREAMIVVARAAGTVLAVGYVVVFAATMTGGPDLAFDYSLDGIAAFFGVPGYLLIGWVHYLAFDLWVGSWEAEEAPRAGMPHALLLPCLFLTFMLGPVGLLAFLIIRALFARRK
jgi:hypothetical protein